MNIGPLNISDLKEKFTEKWSELLQRIQDSALYNTLLESYQNLSQRNQKRILIGVLVFLCFTIFSIPIKNFISSSNKLEDYETKRRVVNDLIQLNLSRENRPQLDHLSSFEKTKQRIQFFLKKFKLLETQVNPVTTYKVPKNFGPSKMESLGFSLSFNQLNLNQVIDIGQGIINRSPLFKIVGLEMNENKEKPLYFDVVFKIAKFGVSKENEKRKGKKIRKVKKNR